MSNRKYILLAWFLLAILLLPTASPAGTTSKSTISIDAVSPDLAAAARKVPLRGDFRLNGLELDGIPGAGDLELERFEVFTPDAKVLLDDSEILSIPDNRYFKGRIAGEPGSRVLLTLRQSGELRGLVFRDGELWILGGGAGSGIVAPGLVSRRADPGLELAGKVTTFSCETDRLRPLENLPKISSSSSPSIITEQGSGPPYVAGVAIETDIEYFAAFGNNIVDATDYAADLIAYSSVLYEEEVNTSLRITYLKIWSTSDPWDKTGCPDMLDQLQAYWQAANSNIDRTLVHMLSGKNQSSPCGGAWVGYLCDKQYGFGISSGLTYGFEIEDPGIGWDIMVVSHEIGHTFNSPHTNCYSGIGNNQAQVDQCTNSDCGWNPISYDCYCGAPSLPCSGQSGCGTLMSYCHFLSGGMDNIAWTFGTGHPYGNAPYRVPMRMYDHVVHRANSVPGCFDPVLGIKTVGTGNGTVTSNPTGIACGYDCAEIYEPNSVVNLIATPGANFVFDGWSGDLDCDDGNVTMSSNKTCVATFNFVKQNLEIIKSGGGTVTSSPSGIECGGSCTADYPYGTAVSLDAVPDIGSMVGEWTGDADCTDGNLTMDADMACTMTFQPCTLPIELDVPVPQVSTEMEFAACNILTAGDFVVQGPGGDVTFRAGNTIVLKDGFVVESDAAFRAIIGPPPS